MSPTASTLGPPEKSGKMIGSCVGEQMKIQSAMKRFGSGALRDLEIFFKETKISHCIKFAYFHLFVRNSS